ncbi:response regulator [Elusimicrobiota bacterium]
MNIDYKYKVLIVDDETSIRNSCEKALEKVADVVHSAESAEEARNYIKENNYNALLLDIMLPGIGGDEFLLEVKKEYPATEVIMITGKPDVNSAVQTLKSGAFDYLVKPFDIHELRNSVRKAISKGEILIVDDEEGVVKTISKAIIKEFPGIKIRIEKDGHEIKSIVAEKKYDLIFMDIKLMGSDGLQIAEEVIKNGYADPENIVIMTGYPSKEIEEEIKECGLDKYLVKPFFAEKVTEIVENGLNLKK